MSRFTAADVSVVICVFDNAPTIGEAIESVLAQTEPVGEIVVVDDGSTDGSGDVARTFGDRVRVVPQENRGISAARNRGVAETTRPIIAAVDADDRWAPNKLELQLPLLIDGVDAVSCDVAQVPNALWQDVAQGLRAPPVVLRGNTWESIVIKREAFQRIGEFDPGYRLAEQVDWWTRAAEAGLRVESVPEPLVFRRIHRDNHGLRNIADRDEYARAIHAALRRRRAGAATPTTADD